MEPLIYNNASWNKRFSRQSKSLIEHATSASMESDSPEIINGAMQMIDILNGKKRYQTDQISDKSRIRYPVLTGWLNEKPLWEFRVKDARKDAFDIIDYIQSERIGVCIQNSTRKNLENDISDIMALGNERVSKERKVTTRGMFQAYREEVLSQYAPSRVKDTLNLLTDLLQGKAKNLQTGKRIWSWKDRINLANILLNNLEKVTEEEFKIGNIAEYKTRQIFINAKNVLNIGILNNNYLIKRYNRVDSSIDIYSPFLKLVNMWKFDAPKSIIHEENKPISLISRPEANFNYFHNRNIRSESFFSKFTTTLKRLSVGTAGLITSLIAQYR